MKNKLFLLTIILSITVFTAIGKTKYATVNGSYNSAVDKKVTLYEVKNGDLVEHSVVTLGQGGTFAFSLIPSENGFYYIGTEKDYHRVYLQPDMLLNVAIDVNTNKLTLVGKNSPENILVNNWSNIIYEVERMAVKNSGFATIYTDFYPALNKTVEEYEKFISKIKSGDSNFCQLMKYYADSDIRYYALQFLSSGRREHPAKGNITDFHKKILAEPLIGTQMLTLPYAWRYLDNYISVNRRHFNYGGDADFIDLTIDAIKDPAMKSSYVMKQLVRTKTNEQYHAFMAKYGKYIVNTEDKNGASTFGAKFVAPKIGAKAVDFFYPDINGKIHSLADFKGKVVLIDVWATWCGPCVKELPSLKKLEEEFHGKDVVFVSISVDRDKRKWENYVKKEKLGGVQLLGDQDIRTNYDIKGIPRFMLFDKNGMIVTTDSPRPSNAQLKALIENELKK